MRAELRFGAMGTWAHLIAVDGPHGLLAAAQAEVEDLERRWSRFLPTSEVSRINGSAGWPVAVSAETAALMERAEWGRRATGGRFDPAVPSELVTPGAAVAPLSVTSSTFDPGGIGKGYAADLVAGLMLAGGAGGACVNIGGDLRVMGPAPGGGAWVVEVADPFGGPPPARLALEAGAVATSSRVRRAWADPDDGTPRHHVIDPSTGRPAWSGVAAVTVVADEAWRAEVLATAALVAGVEQGLTLIQEWGATGLVVDDGAGIHRAPGVEAFLV